MTRTPLKQSLINGNSRGRLFKLCVALAMFALATSVAASAHADRKAKYRPVGISIFDPVAVFHGKDTVVVGLSVNVLYGRSRAVYGVEIGLFNKVDRDVGLLQIGLGNIVGGGCYGICAAGSLNLHGKLTGAQVALFGNDAGSVAAGVQVGIFNSVRRKAGLLLQVGVFNLNHRQMLEMAAFIGAKKGDVVTIHRYKGRQHGMQLGLLNQSDDYRGIQFGAGNFARYGKGVQIGIANVSRRFSGLQVGAWNHATKMHGLQIGLVNTARYLHGIQLGIINVATRNKLPFTVLINAGF